MTRRRINRLPGMPDVTGRDYRSRADAVAKLVDFLTDAGYGHIDPPLLEETELFVRKSGGELTSGLYTFIEPGGRRVSLRPEFTSSVIRHFIDSVGQAGTPYRCQYNGPVFRYEPGDESDLRQFTQVGAELVGDGSPGADAEIMALAWSGLRQIGLDGHTLRIGHLGSIHGILGGYALSEAARLFIVGHVQDLKDGRLDPAALRRQAEGVGLLPGENGTSAPLVESEAIDQAAADFVRRALSESISSSPGGRTSEEIIARMLRKTRSSDDGATFERASEAVSRLARLEGSPNEVLDAARRVGKEFVDQDCFSAMYDLVRALVDRGLDDSSLTLDLGLARGIAYYTGVIFEIIDGSARSLGGGGRYDGLIRALGGDDDVPALGFAYNMDLIIGSSNEASLESKASV